VGLKMLVDGANRLNEGVWLLPLAPHEVRQLGEVKTAVGELSVILVNQPSFNTGTREFRFDATEVTVLNVGTLAQAVALSIGSVAPVEPLKGSTTPASSLGLGDKEFITLAERELEGGLREAARKILTEVRAQYPGDLKRGLRMNFNNVPDNFWGIIIQPRARSLLLTVRGTPDRFQPSSLNLKPNRASYTRFIVDRLEQVDETLRIIRSARRK
jgi:hypothetical protein